MITSFSDSKTKQQTSLSQKPSEHFMSAMHKDTEQIIQEYNKDEISISISRAYKQCLKKITDKVFLPAYNKQC